MSEVTAETRTGEETLAFLDCYLCGSEIVGKDPRPGWYHDGEEITCGDCGAINRVSCDGESDPYVGGYTCKHGTDDETPCEACEVEDGIGVGES